jgi:hypothetical protein
VRDLAHFVDNILCYIGWLWPLWDDKSQTLSDKIMGTVVIQADDSAAPNPYAQPGAFAGGYPPPGQQPGPFGQPPSGGFQQQPQSGGFGQPQPPSGGFAQPPSSGGFPPQQPASGGFPQAPQPGGFGQQPGQPLAPPPGGSAFDEQAERTQMLRPEAPGEAEATQKIDPGQFGQPPKDQPPHQ